MLALKERLYYTLLLFLLPLITTAQMGNPRIQPGTIKVNGEVSVPKMIKKDSVWLYLTVIQPITGEGKAYKTLLDYNGRFSLDVKTQLDLNQCNIYTDVNPQQQIIMMLKTDQENKILISYTLDSIINKVKSNVNSGLTEEDYIRSYDKWMDLIYAKKSANYDTLYNKDFDIYIQHINNILQWKWSLLDKPPYISEKMKALFKKEFTFAIYRNYVLFYREEMINNYMRLNNKEPDNTGIKKTVRENYSFLKKLDLNNPFNLYCGSYSFFIKKLLEDTTLNIPPIQDTPIQEWTNNVNGFMENLLGFKQGLFYDILICNAYTRQFNTASKPLTSAQIKAIKDYFKGNNFEKILLELNHDLLEQTKEKQK